MRRLRGSNDGAHGRLVRVSRMDAGMVGAVVMGVALVGCAARQPVSEPATTKPSPPMVRLVAVSWRGEFFAQDPADGFLVPVGHTGFTRINSLTVTPDERVLAVADSGRADGVRPVLIEIDPATGRGSVVCELDRESDVRALACAPSGALYAAVARPDDMFRTTMAEIDPRTGHVATLRETGLIGVQGMEFCPHGELFSFANAQSGETKPRSAMVLRVNAEDWSARTVSETSDRRSVESLAFDACDVGYLALVLRGHDEVWATAVAGTETTGDPPRITVGDAVWELTDVDLRGIGFLRAHGHAGANPQEQSE